VSRLPGVRRLPRVPRVPRPGAPFGAAGTLLVLIAAVAFPLVEGGSQSVMGLATLALVYGLVTLSLNLLMGYGGQVSVGHGGFLAVGAYTTAIVATHFTSLPFIVVLLLAGVVTGAVGFLLGLPAGRLRSHYLAVATLGFGLAMPQIALNMGITGGFTGLVTPTASVGRFVLNNPVPLYYLALAVLAVSALAIRSILSSPTGRRFMAVRDSEHTAPAMGINPWRTKVLLFTLSAFFCGLAGYVFAFYVGVVEPASFDFALSLFFVAAVIVGGMASIWGSLIGAALLVVVQQESLSAQAYSETILGVAVIVVLLLVPGGLAAVPRRVYSAVTRIRARRADAAAGAATPHQSPAPSPAGAPPAERASREG
jgi:branched-chain amino acid transport system permease protein